MSFMKLRKFYYLFATVALLSQLLGLIFCGDAACLQGRSDEDCVTLLCSLLAEHAKSTPTPDDDPNNSCQCFCHLLIDLPRTTLCPAPLGVTPFHTSEKLQLVSTPIRDIDHPPSA
jgi:hypothetical protein